MAVNISGILQIIQRFFALWGQPTVMLCNNSSEFVGAEKKLHQMINILNQEEVKVLWREECSGSLLHQLLHIRLLVLKPLLTPTKAPWRKPLLAITHNIWAICGLPRGTQSDEPKTHQTSPNDSHNGSYLCPNEILLGHASSEVPHGPFKEKNSCHKVPRDHLKNHWLVLEVME